MITLANNSISLQNIKEKEIEYAKTIRNFITRIESLDSTLACARELENLYRFFMKMDETRIEVATSLLTRGWIKLDDINLKAYLDGFTMSFRNGLYYEETEDYSFKPVYTYDDYEMFLREEDNQINHEAREILGYQNRPLKKPLKMKNKP